MEGEGTSVDEPDGAALTIFADLLEQGLGSEPADWQTGDGRNVRSLE
jgi:hypothetical protein